MWKKYGAKTDKDIFKKLFGRQSTTKSYSVRNWIWTFSTNDKENIVHCLISSEGIAWQYDPRSKDKKQVVRLVKHLKQYLLWSR